MSAILKSWGQIGFDCPQWGDLFDYVILILTQHKPNFLLIQNVPNMMHHKSGRTWEVIETASEASAMQLTPENSRHIYLACLKYEIVQLS